VVPFCLLGLCIGLRARSSAAIALSNILFLALAVLGGLWIPLFVFPHWMQDVAVALPTTHLAALALSAAGRTSAGGNLGHAAAVAAFAVVFAALAWRSWTRAMR
jgi:ABC-2 type transport system permease protein